MKRKSERKKPPSRARYEQEHPTISIRLSREVRDRLDEIRAREGKSFGDIIREAVGVQEKDTSRSHDRGLKEGHEQGEEEGYKRGLAECGRLAAEKIDTERALNERQAGLSEEIRSLQAVNTGLQSRLRRAQEDIARARAVARDPDEKIAAIVSLLKGSDDLRTLESILDLALKACSVAADERVGWASRIDLAQQTFRVLELRQWLRNKLRPALEPSEEERILVEYKIRIHGKACVVCASSLCEEGEIIAWAHDRCTRREP